MYEGFKRFEIQTSDPEVKIAGRVGGKGPPALLLHGNPLTHVHWHLVAPRLAQDFTVVATDLRGYGDSGKPRGKPDHGNYSFRRMAQDQVDVMAHLGFKQFFVAGHDRGARTAHRMALDHPDKVKKFAAFDILPTHHVLTNISLGWALGSFHWFFMAQPYDIPEKLIEGKEDYYILNKLTKMGIGKGGFSQETLAEYARCCTPENIHGVCEDYRAAVTLDFEMDRVDFEAGRKVACPAAIYWGEQSHTEKYFDPRTAWPQYCSNLARLRPLPCGHYPAEQAPDEVYEELNAFFRG
ncbi:MAG: alpha/beta hydrolase [Betaproteobacteria bacterium]|nr:alpha/beta hydrolase [Betaproteobacteria bacterium]